MEDCVLSCVLASREFALDLIFIFLECGNPPTQKQEKAKAAQKGPSGGQITSLRIEICEFGKRNLPAVPLFPSILYHFSDIIFCYSNEALKSDSHKVFIF